MDGSDGCGCPDAATRARSAGELRLRSTISLPRCVLGEHAHDEPRIVLTPRGRFETRHRSVALAGRPGRALFRPRFEEHRDTYAEPTRCVTVILPFGSPAWPDLGSMPLAVGDEHFAELAAELIAEMDRADVVSPLVLEGLCAQLVARVRGHESRERPRWVSELRAWLDEAYAAPPTLSQVAAIFERDAAYVTTAFKRSYGRTVGAYVRERQLWHARRLIGAGSMSLAEIAPLTGFADQSHLTRRFNARFGLSPGAYRRRRA